MNLMSRAEEIVLLAVYKLADNAYGVTIREQIHKDIGRYWSFGVIYKTLKKINSKEYVIKIAGEPVAEPGGRTRFFYRITSLGRKKLAEIQRIQLDLWEQVNLATADIKKNG